MKFDNLAELAKSVSNDILNIEFRINKKVLIDNQLNLDIQLLPKDSNGDMAREEPEEFIRLVNNYTNHKLNYMYEEGFLYKEEGYYKPYTKKQLQEIMDSINEHGVDMDSE